MKHIVMTRERYDENFNKRINLPASTIRTMIEQGEDPWNVEKSDLVVTLEALPDVTVTSSNLYSLQVELLKQCHQNDTVILIGMALRYPNVEEHVREFNLHVYEFHPKETRPQSRLVTPYIYADDEDLVFQIEHL